MNKTLRTFERMTERKSGTTMGRSLAVAALVAGALALGGCAHRPNNAQLGTGVGAVAGGVLGSALFGTTLGTVGGAAAGALVGPIVDGYVLPDQLDLLLKRGAVNDVPLPPRPWNSISRPSGVVKRTMGA